ncbi:hypothetical protein Tco_1323945 [Tanacetum coccineum]
MLDYGFNLMNTKIYIDNESTICIVKNSVFHSKTKHIEIIHHFIRDSYEKKLIQVIKIHTDHNVADLLTKAFHKPIIVPSSYQHKKTHKPRKTIRTTEISQSSGPINLVAHETVYKEWEDIMERAATTASSLDAERDRGSGPRCHVTILGDADAQTRIEAASKQSNDPPLSGGYTLRSGEDNGTDCLPTATIFEELARMGRITTLFATMMVQANQKEGEDTDIPIDSQQTPITTQLSKSKPQKKQSRRKQKNNTEVPHPSDSTADVPNKVLDLEHTKTAQAQEITNLKLRVNKLGKKAGFRTHNFKRLYKFSVTRRVESSDDESLGA